MLSKNPLYVAECDFCSEYHETDEDDFIEAVNAIKDEGWKVFKENGEWKHMCPSCREDDRQDEIKRKFKS